MDQESARGRNEVNGPARATEIPSVGHFTFNGRLQPKGHGSRGVRIVLDSGATSNFISGRFTRTYRVPLKPKARPILL